MFWSISIRIVWIFSLWHNQLSHIIERGALGCRLNRWAIYTSWSFERDLILGIRMDACSTSLGLRIHSTTLDTTICRGWLLHHQPEAVFVWACIFQISGFHPWLKCIEYLRWSVCWNKRQRNSQQNLKRINCLNYRCCIFLNKQRWLSHLCRSGNSASEAIPLWES